MKKFLKGFLFAGKGLSYAFLTQLNFKFHCGAAVLVVALGLYCKLTSAEWIYITFAVALVLVMELMNTAVELLVDLISPQKQVLAGAAKDVAASAVLISALMALVVGLFIFIPKFS